MPAVGRGHAAVVWFCATHPGPGTTPSGFATRTASLVAGPAPIDV
jgi:hypothetical protein